jgi:hypothetical protein
MNDTFIMILLLAGCIAVTMLGYGICHFIRHDTARFRRMIDLVVGGPQPSIKDWDRSTFLYRIPCGIFTFLTIEYVLLWLTIGLVGEGRVEIEGLASLLYQIVLGMDKLFGVIGAIGIVITTIFGIYDNFPPFRFKTLGIIVASGILIGLGERLF